MHSRRPALNFLWASGFGPKGGILSRRISLSPFPTLRHHSGTLSGPSVTFQAYPSLSIMFLPSQSTPFLTPPTPSTLPSFTTVSGITVSPVILHFYPYPVSIHSSPFPSAPRFYPPFSVSIRTPFLPLRSPFSARQSSGQAFYQILLLTDIWCLATLPYISVSFPYISRYT